MGTPTPAEPFDFDSLWDYSKPQDTERKFRALLGAAETSETPGYYAELLTQLARTKGLQRQFDSAHRILDSVEPLLKDLGPRPRARYLLERGRSLNSSGQPAEAALLFREAWALARSNELDFFTVDAAHMLAIVAPPEEQIQWNRKAVQVAEKSSDPRARRWLGSLWNNMGWTYFDQRQYDSALVMFESALAFRIAQNQKDEIRVARWCVAKVHRHLGRVDEALLVQKALLTEIEESGAEPDGFVFEELAECLLAQNHPDQARPYFEMAYRLLSGDPWFAANEAERLERLRRQAEAE